MVRPKLVHSTLTLILCAGFSVPMPGQTAAQQALAPYSQGRAVPGPVTPAPFTTDTTRRRTAYSIEFRSEDKISEADRLVLADAESSIAEHARIVGFEFDQRAWSRQQLVCPALPNHVFLQYMRNNGAGDSTVFSVSIPRGGEGRVRIIPVLRRGYSLFSPAPINAMTIAAFNHIRAEEQSTSASETKNASDWLGNALCYAALAGAHPQILPPLAGPAVDHPIPMLTAMLEVEPQAQGKEVIRFDDAAAIPRPMEWTMTFTHQGKLVKASHVRAGLQTARPASNDTPVRKTWQVPQSKN